MGNEAKIWIAWPKKSSGIKSDLSRDSTWAVTYEFGLVPVSNISINETWSALRFKKSNGANAASENHNLFIDRNPAERPELIVPAEMQEILEAGGVNEKFNQLSYTHRKEYIEWVTGAKRPETKIKRLSELVAKVSLNKTEIGIYGNGKNYSLLSAVIISLHHISQYY
ncbi:MAG: YdeI/OmpD-associated family protein [Bacteroidota bacterium]